MEFVAHIGPRHLGRALAAVPGAVRALRRNKVQHVVTTGAAMAVPYMLAGALLRLPITFIESAARQVAPSLTGRIAAALPRVRLYCQAQPVLGPRWRRLASVFDGYMAEPRTTPEIRRVVVSLGGERFPFPRAIERIRAAVPEGVEVVWQTGSTPAAGLEGAQDWFPSSDLVALMREADVVFVHAGVGSALAALDVGKAPVLLVRRQRFGEHIDDHQEQIALMLVQRGLAVAPSLESFSWADAEAAASREIKKVAAVERITL
ncbi:MAG: glycosyltransferase [Propioniciclava sp.]|uniref:hypothetical protein n=1 Tax=Propioniciclava sp. TaxID=2038686 RepID=UPI0039E64A02